MRAYIHRVLMDLSRLAAAPSLLVFRIRRVTKQGAPHKQPIRGGCVVVANHSSFADPFLVGCTFWYRRMFFLGATEVMQGKIKGWLLKHAGVIEIDRNAADIEAIRRSVQVLQQGHLLTVFPEGQINRNQMDAPIKSGAVLIALQGGVPIVPVYIAPKKKWYHRRTVAIGSVIDPTTYVTGSFPTTGDIQAITQQVDLQMKELSL